MKMKTLIATYVAEGSIRHNTDPNSMITINRAYKNKRQNPNQDVLKGLKPETRKNATRRKR